MGGFGLNRDGVFKGPGVGDPTNKLHKHVTEAGNHTRDHSRQLAELQRQISQLLLAQGNVTSNLYPFKIYQLPQYLRQTTDNTQNNFSDATDWRKVRVRTGAGTVMFLPNGNNPVQVHSIINVDGTDAAVNPDIETYLDNAEATDILVPEGDDSFMIWVTLIVNNGIASFQLFFGDDPDSAGDTSDWSSFPQMDQYHQIIGFLDSATYASINYLNIRQIARGDLLFSIC